MTLKTLDQKRYFKYSDYLANCFGCKVRKVSIDAGLSCPNRDGTKGKNGCLYCDNKAFNANTRNPAKSIESQISVGIELAKSRYNAKKFIIYFQAHTNTYGSPDNLKKKYDVVKKFDDIVGLAIGTRPDCVNEDILDLIDSYSNDYEVWIEYGLQSIHNKTLDAVRRAHSYEDFLKTYYLTRTKKKIKICAHVIIGLPGEKRGDIIETAKALGSIKVDGVKIHPIHVVKNTALADLFRKGSFKPLSMDEYVDWACDFLEYLWPGTVIQRISADCPRDLLLAPEWMLKKNSVLNSIDKKLQDEGRFQGRRYLWQES